MLKWHYRPVAVIALILAGCTSCQELGVAIFGVHPACSFKEVSHMTDYSLHNDISE